MVGTHQSGGGKLSDPDYNGVRPTGYRNSDRRHSKGARGGHQRKKGGSGSATTPTVQVVIEETKGQEKREDKEEAQYVNSGSPKKEPASSPEVSLITKAVMSEGTGEQPVLEAKRSSEGWPQTVLSWCKNWERGPGSVTRVNSKQ